MVKGDVETALPIKWIPLPNMDKGGLRNFTTNDRGVKEFFYDFNGTPGGVCG
jgi:hypothetical protein